MIAGLIQLLGLLSLAGWLLTIGVGALALVAHWRGGAESRAGRAFWALARARDIGWCTHWLAPLHLVGLADRPSGRQMISSYVGKAAANGHRWARVAAFLIDLGAVALGDAPEHCRRAFERYRGIDQ